MTGLRDLMNAVESNPKGSYSKGEVKTILNSVSGTDFGSIEVDHLKRGDVFSATMVGGKRRPWLTLSVRGGMVVAVAITSATDIPGARPARCRYWPGSYVGSTVSVFDHDFARKSFIRPYSNAADIREIEAELFELHQLRPRPKPAKKAVPTRPHVVFRGAAS